MSKFFEVLAGSVFEIQMGFVEVKIGCGCAVFPDFLLGK